MSSALSAIVAPFPEPPHLGRTAVTLAVRGIDIALSLLALIFISPVFAVIAVVIKLEDGGPVFVVEPRLGKRMTEFKALKFRCLRAVASHDGTPGHHLPNRSSVTNTGLFLRKTGLDELPQLVNVLRGDLSLVGPVSTIDLDVS